MEQKRITQAGLMTSTQYSGNGRTVRGIFRIMDHWLTFRVEEAHRKGNARVVVTTEEGLKEIDLQSKREFSQQPPFTNTEVRRRDLDQERQDYEREKQEGT